MTTIEKNINYETIGMCYRRQDFLRSYNENYDSEINNKYYEVYDYLLQKGYDAEYGSTIIFSYMIVNIMERLGESNLQEELRNPFSQFYLSLADDEFDMGIKTFHSNLLERVYTGSHSDKLAIETYAMEAFRIATELKNNKKILIKKKKRD